MADNLHLPTPDGIKVIAAETGRFGGKTMFDGMPAYFHVVVLREDQIDKIAEAVVRKLEVE